MTNKIWRKTSTMPMRTTSDTDVKPNEAIIGRHLDPISDMALHL